MSKTKSAVAAEVSVVAEPLLVPLKQAAQLLGVQVYSIRKLTRSGQIAYRVVGNRWLVNYQALKTFANDSKGPRRCG